MPDLVTQRSSLLVPEPNKPLYDVLNVTGFVYADLPKAVVHQTVDFVSGGTQPDPSFWNAFSSRLAAMNNGGHAFRSSTPQRITRAF